MALLCRAQLLVDWVPLESWRGSLGLPAGTDDRTDNARRLAADVEWGAKRLPFEVKCLPRAMALSWQLRRYNIGHAIVIAVRPPELRNATEGLHAWVEVGGTKLIGDLPGPWFETLRLGG
jgi:hypothetical protein